MMEVEVRLEKTESGFELIFTRKSDKKFFRVSVSEDQLTELCSEIHKNVEKCKNEVFNIPQEITDAIIDLHDTVKKYNENVQQ